MKEVVVNETYQTNYRYMLSEPTGKNFDAEFVPELTPKQMLQLGVFGGNYFESVPAEFPIDWFEGVKLSETKALASSNYFEVNASQPLREWQRKGWISKDDPKGWFLWYCRYYLGRRIPDEDRRQIKRWRAFIRHKTQVQKFCITGDLTCRRRQRQALLHWAYDSRTI